MRSVCPDEGALVVRDGLLGYGSDGDMRESKDGQRLGYLDDVGLPGFDLSCRREIKRVARGMTELHEGEGSEGLKQLGLVERKG